MVSQCGSGSKEGEQMESMCGLHGPQQLLSKLWVPWAQAQHPLPAKPTQEPPREKVQTLADPRMLRQPSAWALGDFIAQTACFRQPSARTLRDFVARMACLARAFIFPSGNSPKRSCQPDLHFTSVSSLTYTTASDEIGKFS